MALPANVSYCTVTGRFLRAVADSSDPGREPDGVPLAGLNIRFEAAVKIVKNETAEPPVTIIMDPIDCTTDDAGYLLGPDGTPSVVLVASDDADLSPHGWTYTVRVSSSTVAPMTFSFIASAGATVDLATVVPVPANPGSQISAWQSVVTQTTTARDETLAARTDVLQAIADFEPGTLGWEDITGLSDELGTKVPTTDVSTSATGTTIPRRVAGRVKGASAVDADDLVNKAQLEAGLVDKAPLASPSFTGNPTVPTQSPGNNSTRAASTAFVAAAVAALINSAPGLMDTLDEIAQALGDDPNFATTMTGLLAAKAPLASPAFTGIPTAPDGDPEADTDQIANIGTVLAGRNALIAALTAGLTGVDKTIYYDPVDGWPSLSSQGPAWMIAVMHIIWDCIGHGDVITPPDMVDGHDLLQDRPET